MADELSEPGRQVQVLGSAAFTSKLSVSKRRARTVEQRLWADATQAATELHGFGVQPTLETISTKLRGRWSRRSLGELLATDKWLAAMERRGIPWDTDRDTLTPLQQSFLTLYFDVTTPATHGAKLSQAGITAEQFRNWMRLPVFAAEMERLRRTVLQDGLTVATQRLVELADGGDLKAIDRVMAFNGEDFRTLTGEDVAALLATIFTVLDEEGVDDRVLTRLSRAVSTVPGMARATMAPTSQVYTLAPAEDS
jgi:hypothetical protein